MCLNFSGHQLRIDDYKGSLVYMKYEQVISITGIQNSQWTSKSVFGSAVVREMQGNERSF